MRHNTNKPQCVKIWAKIESRQKQAYAAYKKLKETNQGEIK